MENIWMAILSLKPAALKHKNKFLNSTISKILLGFWNFFSWLGKLVPILHCQQGKISALWHTWQKPWNSSTEYLCQYSYNSHLNHIIFLLFFFFFFYNLALELQVMKCLCKNAVSANKYNTGFMSVWVLAISYLIYTSSQGCFNRLTINLQVSGGFVL